MAQIRSRRIESKASFKPIHPWRFPVEWLALAITLLAGGIPFAIGKYMEFSLPGPFDSGAYVYAAQAMLQGRHFGTDVVISAQPATLLVNMAGVWLFGFNEIGPKLIQMLMQLAALAMMYGVLRRLYGLPAAVVGVSVAAIYLSAPLIAKYGNVKEQFMISVMVMGICCFVQYRFRGGWWRAALAGALLINAFYFKATGVSAGAAVFAFLIIRTAMRRQSLRSLGRDCIWLLVGAVVGLIPLMIFFATQGRMDMLIVSLPFILLTLAVVLTALATAGRLVVRFGVKYEVGARVRQVRMRFWIAGVAAILVAMITAPTYIYFCGRNVHTLDGIVVNDDIRQDLRSFVVHHPFVNYPWRIEKRVERIWDQLVWITTGRGNYAGASRAAWSFEKQRPIVFRYYAELKLPILLAIASIAAAMAAWIASQRRRATPIPRPLSADDRLRSVASEAVLLFAIWWLLDMLFVWISPRSYEEYYLPLNASAAMTGGFLLGMYRDRFRAAPFKMPWLACAAGAVFIALIMVWPIFVGLSVSPFSGTEYKKLDPRTNQEIKYLARGYAQRLEEIRQRRQNQPPWERVAQVIREQSRPNDGIFVWGWYPGIYVQAQRLSPAPKAFESDMHVISPNQLAAEVFGILKGFAGQMPAFIVDSRKSEFPWGRRPLELWPTLQDGRLIPNQSAMITEYDAEYRKFLLKSSGQAEMLRYDAMEPLRKFVREHYDIVNDPSFSPPHILFRLKPGGPPTPGPRTP